MIVLYHISNDFFDGHGMGYSSWCMVMCDDIREKHTSDVKDK